MSPWTSLSAAGAKVRDGARLLLLLVVALLAGTLLLRGDATAESLWQSPQSPPAEPEAQADTPTPTPQPPPPTPTNTPEPADPEPAVNEQETEPVETTPTETPQPEPSPTPPPTPTDVIAPPTPTPVVAQEPQAQGPAPGPQPAPVDLQRAEQADIPFEEEEEAGSRNLILDRIELIDALAVSGAYVWLCCGVGLLLVLPIFLLVLYIRGRSRILQEESYY